MFLDIAAKPSLSELILCARALFYYFCQSFSDAILSIINVSKINIVSTYLQCSK